MKTTVNFFRTLLLAVLTLTFGACGEDSLLAELGLDGQTATKVEEAGVWQGDIAESFAGGSGTAEDPYLIANGAQLKLFAATVVRNTAACGKLTADILLNDISDWTSWNETTAPANSWTPIGSGSQPFTGTLDGDGHSVSGIYINSSANYQGLVGNLKENGTLQNVGVEASYIKGGRYVGGVCGQNNSGTVTNCYNAGSVAGNRDVGGVCGYSSTSGIITDCYNTGNVTGTGNSVSGVCGQNYGTVTNCHNSGKVTGTSDYTGGVCGLNNSGTVTNCYNTGSVTGDSQVGGVCGTNYRTVTNCYNTGSVTGNSDVGGLCGQNWSTVSNCYNTGSVESNNSVGGVCGWNYNGTVSNCYNTGSVTGNDYVGGLCGMNNGNVTNCYYLTGTAAGGINGSDAAGQAEAKTKTQFKSGEVASLLGEGWGQTIGTDDSPVLTTDASKKVYALDLYNGTPDKQQSYANIGTSFLPEGSNAIALVDADSPFKKGTNIVVKDGDSYTCDNLVLTDDADFYTPVAFTATNATYTRSPKVWATNDGSGSGWETICLPFSGTLYAGEDAKKLILTDSAGDYWLRSLTDFKTPNTLIFASGSTATAADNQIKAGMPYIIALPGKTFGGESLQGQTISVRGTNVKVINTAQSVQPEGSLFAFTGTFATKACDAASYRLNSENGSDEAGDLFVLDTQKTVLAPFRCRVDVTGLNIDGASTRSASGLPKELRIGQ